MKACILTSYYRPKPGGFCRRLFRGINALLAEGHTVHYVAVKKFPIDHPQCFFHQFPWPLKNSDTLLFWAVFHLLAPIQLLYIGLAKQVTHCFAFVPNYALIMQPLRIIKRTPLTLFLRADAIQNHRIKNKSKWLIRIELFVESLAIFNTHLYGVSQASLDSVVKRHRWLKPNKTGVIRNDIYKLSSKNKRDNLPANKIRLSCAGILEPRKNQTLIIEALKNISPELYRLNIYGVGFQKKELLEKVKKYGLEDSIHFKGWIDSEEIWSNTDLLLMPSLHEGAPNSVLEALAHKIPVLASDIPEHIEILQKINLLPVNDPHEWQKKLTEILLDSIKELNIIRSAQEHSAKKLTFDWDTKFVSLIIKNKGEN